MEAVTGEDVRSAESIGPVAWVLDTADLSHLLEQVKACGTFVFDLETTGLHEHATRATQVNGGVPARVVLATFTLEAVYGDSRGDEPTTYVLPLSHPDSPWSGRWKRVLALVAMAAVRYERPVVGHNVKFDCKWVEAHTGVDLAPLVRWDTQVSSHLLDETRSTRLEARAAATFGVEEWGEALNLSYPGAAEEVPLFMLGDYAARDTYWTWRLMSNHRAALYLEGDEVPQFRDEITDARLGTLASWCAMPMVSNLTAIEQYGFTMDRAWVERELAEHVAQRDALLAQMAQRYGMDNGKASAAATSLWFRAWTDAAVAEGDLAIGALTNSGRPQWNKGVLTRQARKGSEVAQLILDQRSHGKMAEYLTSWLLFITDEERIHTTYHAGRVVTGRLSSDNPNLQQVTRALKPAFIPRPGYVLADLDYSQIELRVAAFVSGCEPMIQAFQNGDDLHTMLALQIIQAREDMQARVDRRKAAVYTEEDVTPEDRQAGKSANFGLLYMMGPGGFRDYAEDVYGVSFSLEEATTVHQTFFNTWEGMREWHARAITAAQHHGQVVSPIGRVRRLPDINTGDPKWEARAQRNAVNSPVQGFASDLMQMAAASIGGHLPGIAPVPRARIVATVHDSIVVEVPEDDWEDVVAQCRERMTNLNEVLHRLDCDFTVPLVAEATVGSRWGLSDIGVQA